MIRVGLGFDLNQAHGIGPGYVHPALAEDKLQQILMADEQAEHKHDEYVHDKHHHYTEQIALQIGTLLNRAVGEVERTDDSAHTIGSQYNRQIGRAHV